MSQELQELTSEAFALPYGRARSAALEVLVARAEAEGEEDRAFSHRIDLVEAYVQGGEPRLLFAPFGRCLADLDADPQRYGRFTRRLLWQYKAAIGSMTKFWEVGLAQTSAALDDMERRWLESGHSLHAVHQHRWLVAHHVGDRETAEEQFRAWSTAPRDDLSDCIGCDPDDKVTHLQWTGRHADAVALGLDTLSKPLGCVDQPESMQTTLLPSLVATGRWAEARDAQQRSYRAIRTRPAQQRKLAVHLRFAALTGNVDLAREILARHVHELATPSSPYAAMELSAASARTLRAVAETDPGAVVTDEHGTEVGADVLAERHAAAARALSARFDARNQTTRQSEAVEAFLAEAPWADHLPLLLPVPAAASGAAPARTRPEQRPEPEPVPATPTETDEGDREATAGPEAATTAPETLADPGRVPLDALLDLVEKALTAGELGVVAAGLDRFETERPVADRTDQEEGRVHYARSALAEDRGDADEEVAALRRALVHLDRAGDETRLRRTRAVLGLTLADRGDVDEATATADEALAWLIEHDEPARRAGWALQRVRLDRAANRADEAYAGLRRLFAERTDSQERDEYVALLLTQDELARGNAAEAAGAATRATGSRNPEWWRWSRRFRADARRALGDTEGAIEDRLEALAGSAEVPDAATDPALVLDLGDDYLVADRVSEGAGAAEVALRLLGADGRPDLRERARLQLLGAYRRLREPALALEQVAALQDDVTDETPPLWRAQLLGERGSLLLWLSRWTDARAALVEAAAAYAGADDPGGQVRSLRQAQAAALESGAREDALALWEQAVQAGEGLPEGAERWFQQGWLWVERAELDLQTGDRDAARASFDRAESTFHRGGFGDQAAEAVLRRAEGVGADVDDLRAIFVAAEPAGDAWFRSGWLLVDALAAAHHDDESARLAAELEATAAGGSATTG